jgi:hypothetical protein
MISSGLVTICSATSEPERETLSVNIWLIELVGTYDLGTTCRTTSDQLPKQRDPSRLRVHRL